MELRQKQNFEKTFRRYEKFEIIRYIFAVITSLAWIVILAVSGPSLKPVFVFLSVLYLIALVLSLFNVIKVKKATELIKNAPYKIEDFEKLGIKKYKSIEALLINRFYGKNFNKYLYFNDYDGGAYLGKTALYEYFDVALKNYLIYLNKENPDDEVLVALGKKANGNHSVLFDFIEDRIDFIVKYLTEGAKIPDINESIENYKKYPDKIVKFNAIKCDSVKSRIKDSTLIYSRLSDAWVWVFAITAIVGTIILNFFPGLSRIIAMGIGFAGCLLFDLVIYGIDFIKQKIDRFKDDKIIFEHTKYLPIDEDEIKSLGIETYEKFEDYLIRISYDLPRVPENDDYYLDFVELINKSIRNYLVANIDNLEISKELLKASFMKHVYVSEYDAFYKFANARARKLAKYLISKDCLEDFDSDFTYTINWLEGSKSAITTLQNQVVHPLTIYEVKKNI